MTGSIFEPNNLLDEIQLLICEFLTLGDIATLRMLSKPWYDDVDRFIENQALHIRIDYSSNSNNYWKRLVRREECDECSKIYLATNYTNLCNECQEIRNRARKQRRNHTGVLFQLLVAYGGLF